MIADSIKNLKRYTSLSQNLKEALDYLSEHDLMALPVGISTIDDDRIKIIVVDRPLTEQPTFWESHEKYIDVHAVVRGTEIMRCLCDHSVHQSDRFDESSDSHLYYRNFDGNSFCVMPGEVLIMFPGEIHQTNIPYANAENVKKVILKVKA